MPNEDAAFEAHLEGMDCGWRPCETCAPASSPTDAPEPRPGVKPERLNAYLAAKEQAPRGALPSDLLALAAFLAAIDEEPEPTAEEDAEVVGSGEFDDDRAAEDEADVCLADEEDEEDAGFEPVTGRDAWPTVVAWMTTAGVRLTPWQHEMAKHFFK